MPIPRGDEVGLHAHQQALDRALARVALHDRRAPQRILQVMQDHQALIQDAAVGQLQHRQRGPTARPGEPCRVTRLRDIDDVEVERVCRALQREQDLQPLVMVASPGYLIIVTARRAG